MNRIPVFPLVVRLAGLFLLVQIAAVFVVLVLIPLPSEPLLRYAVLALPTLAACIVVALCYGMWTRRHAPPRHEPPGARQTDHAD